MEDLESFLTGRALKEEIHCPYCDAEWSQPMLRKLKLCEGSYTADCVASKFVATMDINCDLCGKLIYRKEVDVREIQDIADMYDEERWKDDPSRIE